MWTITDVAGAYVIPGVPIGSCSLTITKAGYITVVSQVNVAATADKIIRNQSIQKKPTPNEMKEISFTLNWNSQPTDVDAHLLHFGLHKGARKPESIAAHLNAAAKSHFSWMSRGQAKEAPFVTLDIDIMTGKGPETITMHKLVDGHFLYYVKCYSCFPWKAG